jgi:hypothetical protein
MSGGVSDPRDPDPASPGPDGGGEERIGQQDPASDGEDPSPS